MIKDAYNLDYYLRFFKGLFENLKIKHEVNLTRLCLNFPHSSLRNDSD